MRKFVVAMIALGAAAGSAEAGLVCATPGEMKVLQSAALQQQLMVAALSCHLSADYNRFVTAYRGKLIQSDTELKTFFAGHRRGEDYNAYKTRIANTVSLKSLHDPRFCDSAQRVFDMALGRGDERRGLVPEPPQLIDTGYEGCRNVDDAPIEAKVEKPQVKLAAVAPKLVPKPAPTRTAALDLARPIPVPRPVVTPATEKALALAPRTVRPQVTAVVPKPTPKPAPKLAATPRKPVMKLAEARPVPVAKQPDAPRAVVTPAAPRPQRLASAAPPDDFAAEDARASGPQYAPPPRTAVVERPEWRRPTPEPTDDTRTDDRWSGGPPGDDLMADDLADDDGQTGANDDLEADDNVPNAYRPGSEWVSNDDSGWRRPPPAAWRSAGYGPPPDWRVAAAYPPPRWHRRLPPGARMVLGPDGRWMVVIARGRHWVRH